ncbi:MAG: hypothetical protein AB7I27_07990 [Bacteriovoracaceae bacterium]
MRLLITFGFYLLSLSAHSSSLSWRVFYIESFSAEKIYKNDLKNYNAHCSATLLKFQDGCHLITNAHCFKSYDDYAVIAAGGKEGFGEHEYDLRLGSSHKKSAYDFFYRSDDVFWNLTKIKKRFITKDLTELNLTESLQKQCDELKVIDLKKTERLGRKALPLAGIGFFMSAETITFSQDIPWAKGKGKTLPDIYSSSLNLEKFYQIPNLVTFRGMSGGLIIDEDKNPLAIITRHIPYQQETYAIGLSEVEKFVSEEFEPTPLLPELFLASNPLAFQDNKGEFVGENAHGNGGESEKLAGAKLSLLRLPLEGVIDPFNPKQIILNKCGHQIDGYDDYLHQKSCIDSISRDADGYPSEDIREKILERMFGNLTNKNIYGEGQRLLFYQNEQFLDQWHKLAVGQTRNTVLIGSSHFFIHSKSVNMKRTFDGEKLEAQSETVVKIYFSLDDDSKKLIAVVEHAKESLISDRPYLEMTYTNLECDNRNFLKLICFDQNDKVEFSLSRNEVNSNSIDFRLAIRSGLMLGNLPGKELITYNFGKLTSDESKGPSMLPLRNPIMPNINVEVFR